MSQTNVSGACCYCFTGFGRHHEPGCPMTAQRFIVAEISKNWPEPAMEEAFWGAHPDATHAPNGMRRLLSERFEEVINRNLEHGYRLSDWRYSRIDVTVPPDAAQREINETIIAVFELVAE